MTNLAKIETALRELGVDPDRPIAADHHLRDDLGLDSASLIELTVVVHTRFGVDLGRRSAERKILPTTVGDLAALLADA